MTDLYPVVLHRSQDSSWVIMPTFIRRVMEFAAEHDGRNGRKARARFMEDFGTGRGQWFGLALVDKDGAMRGHILACLEHRNMTGDTFAMVWQWAKDTACDPMIDDHCRQLLEGWAKAQGAARISALALTPSRARLFARFGFVPGPQLITREVDDG